MKQQDFFNNAMWLGKEEHTSAKTKNAVEEDFYVLRGHFQISNVKEATLYVLGLGFFHCYINGKRVGEDLFLPLSTDYEKRNNYPANEVISGHRIYVPQYDVTSLLEDGDNTIAIHFGGGWYTYDEGFTAGRSRYGNPKVIWRILGQTNEGAFEFVSSTQDLITKSFVTNYYFVCKEEHDYTVNTENIINKEFDDSAWEHAICVKPLDTEYQLMDCPADRVQDTLQAICIHESEKERVYDCGSNISGYPVIRLTSSYGEKVEVFFSEEKNIDHTLNTKYGHRQSMVFISDGNEREVRPLFTWFGFRYFSIVGDAEVIGVEVVHTNVKCISEFQTDNELLNWIHNAYVRTQQMNMHTGIPSDCPHLERRGYTGDGQLTCHAVMNIFDAKKFYKKWILDIKDCQDTITGHVQNVAPYLLSGGGPGGWGCAIVEVPYQYYQHYKDIELLETMYPSMLLYFEYLESHSYAKLVVKDKEGQWCLGDWCSSTELVLPAPFVNNYFYIKSLNRVIEIAKLIRREQDIPKLEQRVAERKEAIISCYYNSWDGNFIGNRQGANAFAVDIGLGDERTYKNMVAYYEALGHYDTGIFGTDIVTRIMFEHGDGQTAVKLLLSKKNSSYYGMQVANATTLWEYWPKSLTDRSHNHPMFGAVVAYFYDYLAGIQEIRKNEIDEYLIISPVVVDDIHELHCKKTLLEGTVVVDYKKQGNAIDFKIEVPKGLNVKFIMNHKKYLLQEGVNEFRISNIQRIEEKR